MTVYLGKQSFYNECDRFYFSSYFFMDLLQFVCEGHLARLQNHQPVKKTVQEYG